MPDASRTTRTRKMQMLICISRACFQWHSANFQACHGHMEMKWQMENKLSRTPTGESQTSWLCTWRRIWKSYFWCSSKLRQWDSGTRTQHPGLVVVTLLSHSPPPPPPRGGEVPQLSNGEAKYPITLAQDCSFLNAGQDPVPQSPISLIVETFLPVCFWIWGGFSVLQKRLHCNAEGQMNGPRFFFVSNRAGCKIRNWVEEFH